MGSRRITISEQTRTQVFQAQKGKCALCDITHPLEIHHIVPIHRAGSDSFENLMLLCRNHHDLADSGVLTDSLLKYYKKVAISDSVFLPSDPTVIYEITANNIVKDLLQRNNIETVKFALTLLQRLRRAAVPRYRKICLELIYGITHASMHVEEVDIRGLRKLHKLAVSMAKDLGNDGNLYIQLITNCLGVSYHIAGKYSAAKEAFEFAIDKSLKNISENEQVVADASLARVRMSATEHLIGNSDVAFDNLRSVIDVIPPRSGIFADTNCFAQIKLAEHMLVRGNFEQARTTLENANNYIKNDATNVLPIYRVILLKDLAKVNTLLGDKDRGLRVFIKALALAEFSQFHDQYKKIIKMASELNIKPEELGADH